MTLEELKENYKIKINGNKIYLNEYIGTNKNITIPAVINNYNVALGKDAFEYKNIDSVIIEEGIQEISSKCFYNSGIKNIVLPKSVNIIHALAFCGCQSLKHIDISNVKEIERSVFRFAGLEKITFPDIEKIPSFTCSECKDLSEIIISPTTKEIEFNAFEETNIKQMDLKNVKILGCGAFRKCCNLQTIKCDKLATIEETAFYECTNLNYLKLPSIRFIDSHAFAGCENIEKIEIEHPFNMEADAFSICSIKNLIITKNANLYNCFYDTKIEHLYLNGKENEIDFMGSATVKINELVIANNAKIYTNSLNNSYMPNIKIFGELKLVKNNLYKKYQNIMFNIYQKQSTNSLEDIKFNMTTSYNELLERDFSIQQINQILKAQDTYDLLLSGVNMAITPNMIRSIIDINDKNKNLIDKIKLIACDQKLKPLDYEIELNKAITEFYNSLITNKEEDMEYDNR